jgi:hypothetical protein
VVFARHGCARRAATGSKPTAALSIGGAAYLFLDGCRRKLLSVRFLRGEQASADEVVVASAAASMLLQVQSASFKP